MREVTLEKAIQIAGWEEDEVVYMLVRIWPETTIKELSVADRFLIADKPAPDPEKPKQKKELVNKVDHARIVALYTANPPRTVSWIADDVGCSVQTVINHLVKEGIYKQKEAANNGKDSDDD